MSYEGSRYRVHYRCASESLLRMAIPFFPGWRAKVDGRELRTVPSDLALTGILVPPGGHDLDMPYWSTWFATGSTMTALTWLAALIALLRRRVCAGRGLNRTDVSMQNRYLAISVVQDAGGRRTRLW